MALLIFDGKQTSASCWYNDFKQPQLDKFQAKLNSNPKTILIFFAAFLLVLNWCSVMRPFPYPPENIRKPKVYRYFQVVQKKTSGLK